MKSVATGENGVGTFASSVKLPGNRSFRVQANSSALKGQDAFTALGGFKAELSAAEGKSFDGEQVDALTAEEILTLAGAVTDLTGAVIATRKVQDALDKEISTLQTAATAAGGAAPKEDEAGASERSKILARALNVSVQFQIRLMVVATKYCTDVAKSGLDYAERSLSNIKEEKDDTK